MIALVVEILWPVILEGLAAAWEFMGRFLLAIGRILLHIAELLSYCWPWSKDKDKDDEKHP